MILQQLGGQVALVIEAIRKDPSRKKQILMSYLANYYGAIKETIRHYGSIMPHCVLMSENPMFAEPPVSDEAIRLAKELDAEAIMSVEAFQAESDISDVIYHVSMSAQGVGVFGWVCKVKLGEGKAEVIREMPYLFASGQEVKTLGELIMEMEA